MKLFFTKSVKIILVFFATINTFSQETLPILDRVTYGSYFDKGFNQAKKLFIVNKEFKVEIYDGYHIAPQHMSFSNKEYPLISNTVVFNYYIKGKRKKLLKDTELLVKDISDKKLDSNYKLKKGFFADFPNELREIINTTAFSNFPDKKYPYYIFHHKEDTDLSRNRHPLVIVTFNLHHKKRYKCNIIFVSSLIELKELKNEGKRAIEQNEKRINDLENSYTENPPNYENIFFEALYTICNKDKGNNFNLFKGKPVNYINYDWIVGDKYEANFSWPYAINNIVSELKGDYITDSYSFNVEFGKLSNATKNIFKKYVEKFKTTKKESSITLNNQKEISVIEAYENTKYSYASIDVKVNNHYFRIYAGYYNKNKNLFLYISYIKDYLKKKQQSIEDNKKYKLLAKKKKENQARIDKENAVIEEGKLISKSDIEKVIKILKEGSENEGFTEVFITKNKYETQVRSESSAYKVDIFVFIPKKTINKVTYSNNQNPIMSISYVKNGERSSYGFKNIDSVEDLFENYIYRSFSVKNYKIVVPKNMTFSFYFKDVKDCHIVFDLDKY